MVLIPKKYHKDLQSGKLILIPEVHHLTKKAALKEADLIKKRGYESFIFPSGRRKGLGYSVLFKSR